MYLDADTIVHPDCPNMFEMTDRKYTFVHNEASYDWILRGMEHYHKYLFKDEWFDFATLPESPYMTFAVDAKEKAIHETASIVHVNKTCRVQTLRREQNPHYYDLIMEYYKETQVPLLLNTSFNLAGFPLVESINDALYTLINSKISKNSRTF